MIATLVSISVILALSCVVTRYTATNPMLCLHNYKKVSIEAMEKQHLNNALWHVHLNAGWVRGDGEPLESEQTSVSVDLSEPLPSLQQHTSSGLLQEELHLFQPVSLERATTREY